VGKFIYGDASLRVDDRTLWHLELSIGAVLAVGDSFHFTWREDVSAGIGRTSVWLSPMSRLRYRYKGGDRGALNREWIKALMVQAGKREGLVLLPEPPLPGAPELDR